jgi:hypothetical protein
MAIACWTYRHVGAHGAGAWRPIQGSGVTDESLAGPGRVAARMRKTTVVASRGEDVVSVELWVGRENIYRSELTKRVEQSWYTTLQACCQGDAGCEGLASVPIWDTLLDLVFPLVLAVRRFRIVWQARSQGKRRLRLLYQIH